MDGIRVDAARINTLFDRLGFSDKEATAAVKGAVRQAANTVRRAVSKAAPTSNPAKRKLVNVTMYKSADGANVNIIRGAYTKPGRDYFTLLWLEKGTKKGRRHGATPAKPFFGAAATGAKARAERELEERILARIDKISNK